MLTTLNSTGVRNGDSLQSALTKRPPGAGLITVCNHTRCARAKASKFPTPLAHLKSRSRAGVLLTDGCITIFRIVKASPLCSTVDDPFIISALLPLSFLWRETQHKQNRWSLCAKEICFRNVLLEYATLLERSKLVLAASCIHSDVLGLFASESRGTEEMQQGNMR